MSRRRRGWAISWGFAGQSLSSATNLALAVVAGRALGASGLGRVVVGFSAYMIVLGLHRALLVEPLVAATSARSAADRRSSTSRALTVSLTLGLASTVIVAAAGFAIDGPTGSGLLLVTPWLVPCLLQDLCRWILFRDERPAAGAMNDGAWLAVMAITVPLAWTIHTDWAVMAAWGVGALAATILGLAQLSTPVSGPTAAWWWWRDDAWPFGRWVAGATVLGNLLGNARTFLVATLLSTTALGGLRAAETLFAPLTLVIPALALPGLPAMARTAELGSMRRLAWRYSGLALAGVAAYMTAMVVGGTDLLAFVFGASFAGFSDLAWPIGIAQVLLAAGVGASLMLRARQRGPALLVSRVTGSGMALVLAALFAIPFGVIGVAWAGTIGTGVTSTMQIWTSGAIGRGHRDHSAIRSAVSRTASP
jgi:O-antigen/teichoic acid export membrane protein